MKYMYLSMYVLSAFCLSCATNLYEDNNKVVHIVLIWLNEPGNQAHIDKVITTTLKLSEISEIHNLHVGTSIPSDRVIVDDSFDVGLIMTFNSQQDLEQYLVHPTHKEAVTTILQPLAKKIIVYDFE